MPLEKTRAGNDGFVSISLGKIRKQANEDDPKAIKRVVKRPDGTEVVKHEYVYDSLSGLITDASFRETDYGKMFDVTVDGIVLSINTEHKYFSALASKFPNIDLQKEVSLMPYDFKTDDGKRIVGMNVMQEREKLRSFFYDGEKNTNGMIEPEGDTSKYDKDDWKIYFTRVKKFLINYIEEMDKKFPELVKSEAKEKQVGFDDPIDENDLPF